MSFIDDLLLIVNDIKVEFDHQAYIKQAFFYKYINDILPDPRVRGISSLQI